MFLFITEKKVASRSGSRATVPMATATGFSFGDEYAQEDDAVSPVPPGHREASAMGSNRSGPTPMMLKRSLSPINRCVSRFAYMYMYMYVTAKM